MKKILMFLALIMLVGLSICYAQPRIITGTVVDKADRFPLPGVSVAVKGTTTGTATDINGKFSITVSPGDVLVISFVGMKTQEIAITNQIVINVALESERVAVDEVMVVAYGVSKKSSFTGAAQKVGGDKLADTRVESLDKALSGKVSGVRVSSASGDPGASGDIQIRGIGSITGSTSPLYVIDGVPIESQDFGHQGSSSSILSTINPDDIESMTILKDAAAASLYGSRAANGVVIITTKRGKEGVTKFRFKANYGWSKVATDSYEMMGGIAAADYAKSALEGYQLWINSALFPDDPDVANPTVIQAAKEWAETNYLDPGWTGIRERKNGSNWRDLLYDDGFDSEFLFSVSTGTEKSQYYVSLGYKTVDGIVPTYGFERMSGVLNINSKAREWLDLSFKSQMAYTNQDGRRDQSDQEQGIGTAAPLGLLFGANPTEFAYNSDGTLNELGAYRSRVRNPLIALSEEQAIINTKTYRALNSAMARIKIIPELMFTTTNSVDYVDVKIFEYWGPNSIDGDAVNGLGDRRNNQVITLTSSNVFQYLKTFDEDHNVDVLAGFEVQDFQNLFTVTTANDYSTIKLPELAVGKPDDARSYKYNYFMRSFFGNLKYNYMNKYYGQLSLRMDESSKLGKDNRRGTFWSASASWRFTKEDFFDVAFITDGKIRASFGTNGVLPGGLHEANTGFPVGIYDHLSLYDMGGLYGDDSAIFIDQPENKDLSWEQSENFNVGLEVTLWERMTLSLEYFYKYTKDLLLYVPVSYVTGFDESLQNIGELSNQGFDIEIHAFNVLNNDEYRWDMDLTFSTLKAQMEKLPGGKDIILGDGNLYLYSEGKDLYTFYLPTWVGVEPESGLSQFLIDPSKPATDDNLTYSYSGAKRGPVDKAYPDINGGFTNTFTWKDISFRFLTTFQFGGNLFDYPGYFAHHDGVRLGSFNLAKDVENNYWREPGDKVDNPRPVAFFGNRPDRWSTKHVRSTDYVRMKEISLSYSLPKQWYTDFDIDKINVSLNANNLFFLYTGTDDMELEVNLNGYRTVDTPLARTFSVGLTIDF